MVRICDTISTIDFIEIADIVVIGSIVAGGGPLERETIMISIQMEYLVTCSADLRLSVITTNISTYRKQYSQL